MKLFVVVCLKPGTYSVLGSVISWGKLRCIRLGCYTICNYTNGACGSVAIIQGGVQLSCKATLNAS